MVAKVMKAALQPISNSGLIAEPDRPMMGTNMMKVAFIKHMFKIRGNSNDSK